MQNFPRRTSGRAPPRQAARAPWATPFRIIPDSAYWALCRILHNAHALRERQAVTDAAPGGRWCWASQAAEALTTMQVLAREAISQGRDAADPAALAAQVRLFRSAVLAGASQTAARSGPLMRKHNALARRLRDRQDDYLRFTTDFRAPPDNEGASYCSRVRSAVWGSCGGQLVG
jgi:Transposase IS66 family